MVRKKTDAEFKKEVFDLVGDEYTFIEPYANSSVKIKVKHNKCDNTYLIRPNDFLNGHRCPYCKGGVKKSNLEFKKEVYDLVGKEYTLLDTYVNNKTKIRVNHTRCGNTYEICPSSFLREPYCPYCSGSKKTDTQFKQEVYNLVGDEYTFLDTYVNSYTKIRVKHNKCGNVYSISPSNFLGGNRCHYCYIEAKRKTNSQFKQEVFNLVGDEYTFLDTYVNDSTKLRVKHNKCGNEYEVRPHDFLGKLSRCPYCAGIAKKTNTQFEKEVYDLVGDEYTFLDPYVNNHTKLRAKHNECGNIYGVRPTDFFAHQSRCPYCSSPKGEDTTNKILKSLGIKYEYQKTFDDLKDVQPLSYDFFIPSQNILIEYQGQQHYEPIDYFGGKDKFKLQQKHDTMKSDYAKAHHYTLIAIPYTEDTFSKIKKYLLSHGLKLSA